MKTGGKIGKLSHSPESIRQGGTSRTLQGASARGWVPGGSEPPAHFPHPSGVTEASGWSNPENGYHGWQGGTRKKASRQIRQVRKEKKGTGGEWRSVDPRSLDFPSFLLIPTRPRALRFAAAEGLRDVQGMSELAAHDPVAIALAEDIGGGDATVEFFVDQQAQANARIFAKEAAVVAGAETAREVFTRVDPELSVEVERGDGSAVGPGDTVLTVRGRAGSILSAERVALNFLQRLSGVATLTRRFVDAIEGTPAKILDTRKTTPGLRKLEKAAVAAGGGHNHRLGLYDMVMVKDNHLLTDGSTAGLSAAIGRAKAARPGLRVELEADTLAQVRIFLALEGVDVVLLDNMTTEELRTAVEMGRGGPVQFEASGGVNLETVQAIAKAGVQWISVGALTHSARAIDFSLEFV